MPATGSELISSGITGLAQADCSSLPRVRALSRPSRDRPEPLTITLAAAALPARPRSHWRSTSRAASGVPAPRWVAPSVRKSCCAMTLLLSLLMSRTTSGSGGERSSKLGGVGRRGAFAIAAADPAAELLPHADQGALAVAPRVGVGDRPDLLAAGRLVRAAQGEAGRVGEVALERAAPVVARAG